MTTATYKQAIYDAKKRKLGARISRLRIAARIMQKSCSRGRIQKALKETVLLLEHHQQVRYMKYMY